jgi:hypothetical protein
MQKRAMDDFERYTDDDTPSEHVPGEPLDRPAPEAAPVGAEAALYSLYAPDAEPEPAGEPVVTPEAAMDGVELEAAAATLEPSVSKKRGGPRPDSYEARIEVLSLAIERYPDAAVNYVLRGEAWLGLGFPGNAREDFVAALELAGEAAESARWGYVERTVADRARERLRQLGN